jgi:hypothetical protein
MNDEFSAVCFSPDDAHAAATQAYAHAKAIIANGQNALIECRQALEPITVKQRKFLHGVVLVQVSEQVAIEGHRYTVAIWKDYFRNLFLPDVWKMVDVPPKWDKTLGRLVQPKREQMPKRIRQSTEELGVRAYSEFTEKIIDYATVEWGVSFHFTNEDQALRRTKPKGQPA